MAMNIPGIVAFVLFDVVIFMVGIWAARKAKKEEKKCEAGKSEVTMVGGRNVQLWVGIFTMTASWVGGAFILSSAEAVYSPNLGLIWATTPVAYFFNFVLAGLFFAKPMRSMRYITMLDPFQHRYGNSFTAAILIPALISDILTLSTVLAALGGTVTVILGISYSVSVIVSAFVAVIYTLLGGLYAVAYTDIFQLIITFFGMWTCIPFLMLSPAAMDIADTAFHNVSNNDPWIGEIKLEDAGKWADQTLLLAVGSLAYQVLHQRVLSAASATQAQVSCFAASVIVLSMGIPPILIGAVAASTDWNQTEYGLPPPYERGEAGRILPLALQYLTPLWVSALGISAIAAAAMSSVDSMLLSSASMFTNNLYKTLRGTKASEGELQWVIRISIMVAGAVGTGLAFINESIFLLLVMSGDLLYCIIMPQLVCVVHCPWANIYGAITGYLVGFVLRILSGEPSFGIPCVILYPGWREEDGVIQQYFPYRTLTTVSSLLCILTVSRLAELIFSHRLLPQSWDVLMVFREKGQAEEGDGSVPSEKKSQRNVQSTHL